MKIKSILLVIWPFIVALITGFLIISLVINIVSFSRKISDYYTPVIISSENLMEATEHLKFSLMNKSIPEPDKSSSFIHFKESLSKFKEVLEHREDFDHIHEHEDDIFKDGNKLIRLINSNKPYDALEILAHLSSGNRKHYKNHVAEMTSAQRRITILSYTIAVLCSVILLTGIFLSFRERKAQEVLKSETAIMSAITALINALEARDVYTMGHSSRVSKYAVEVAKELDSENMSDKINLKFLKISSLMHDIGKIGVPDSILSKKGKLTDEEFCEIRKHPLTGANIIKNTDALKQILPGVLNHHERHDGKGYPNGLKGDEIPICAQCIAIADTFDAITSTRPYRKALGIDYAIEEIKKNRGKQWAPEVVDAFLACIDKGTIKKTIQEEF